MSDVGIPAPPQRPPTTRRHSVATMALARTMYADGEGWTPTQIARYLAEQGTIVSVPSVRDWVIPGLAEHRAAARKRHRDAASRRARKAAGGPAKSTKRGPYKPKISGADDALASALKLRTEHGLTYGALAVVLSEYHGVVMTEDVLRYHLTRMGAPRNPNKARVTREQNAKRAASA